MRTLPAAILGLAFAAGCTTFPRPDARVASSEGAIRGAQEVGAQKVPQASLHLKLAQEERAKALDFMRTGEYQRAEYMLMRSEADAELANAMAREVQAKRDAEQASERLEALKSKVGGK